MLLCCFGFDIVSKGFSCRTMGVRVSIEAVWLFSLQFKAKEDAMG